MKIDPILEALEAQKKPRFRFLSQLPIDFPLLGGLLLLSGIAMVVLYSASGQSLDVVLRQGLRLMLALLVMVGVAMIHPRQLANMSPILYLVGALMLALVLLFGKISMGAQRWLDLGIIRFQPSELTKLS
ncbi:MAG: rod shape-determining protein RodA, partial [Gammaproteobacteria bacterium]|nr:rod shape-determining protein RodA [Gammaproteobacteria bacterium]